MSTLRQAARSSYFNCTRAIPQDESLSDKAVALMVYLLSKPDDWEVEFKDVERRYRWGRDKRRKVFAELERAGYFERMAGRDEKQQWEYDLIVHESPLPPENRTAVYARGNDRKQTTQATVEPSPENPAPETQATVEPSPENPAPETQATTHNIEVHKPDDKELNKSHKSERQKIGVPKEPDIASDRLAGSLSTHAKKIVEVCCLPNFLSAKQFNDIHEVSGLHESAGHSLAEIERRFGKGSIWYQFFKNGQRVSPPTPWQTWEQWERIEVTAQSQDSEAQHEAMLEKLRARKREREATANARV